MNILIMGDSWAADWSSKHTDYPGWPNVIAEHTNTVNIAQAGVSQYSICKQLYMVEPEDYDKVIISITSPYRVFTYQHPVHKQGLHAASDLIYTDIEHHAKTHKNNPRLTSAKEYFEHHFDIDKALFDHKLYVEYCLQRLDPDKTIVTSNIQDNDEFVIGFNYLDGYDIWQSYPGKINHLSEEGNYLFADRIITTEL